MYVWQTKELDISEEWWDSFISVGVYKNEYLFWVHHVPQDRDAVWKASISNPTNITWEMEYRPLIVPTTVSVQHFFGHKVIVSVV